MFTHLGSTAILALTLSTTGIATTSKASSTTPAITTYTANFDDLTGRPLGLPAVGDNIPTPYVFLDYIGFSTSNDNTPVQLVKPHSPPNTAASGPLIQLTNGGPPTLSAAYAGSTVGAFDLKSLYFACLGNPGEGDVNLAIRCTMQFNGKKAGSGAGVSQLVPFAPDNLLGDGTVSPNLGASMVQASFGAAFQDVVDVAIVVQSSATLPNLTSILVDDVVYGIRVAGS